MSEFEFNCMSSDSSIDSEDDIRQTRIQKPNKQLLKVSKELNLRYSYLFTDSFNLIDLFVKSKILTYESFLEYFNSTNIHQIYARSTKKEKQVFVTPHHYITTTQDILTVATKFLQSQSREARIGAVYLLYTMYKTQPLQVYLINIKMEPITYKNTKKLVDECFNEGLVHPAYCFYYLDIKKTITITAATINPCLEANYPRINVRKHMGRVADNYFKIEYEKRNDIDLINKLQLMEQQMHTELSYINKLSNLTLGREVAPESKAKLSKTIMEISGDGQFNANTYNTYNKLSNLTLGREVAPESKAKLSKTLMEISGDGQFNANTYNTKSSNDDISKKRYKNKMGACFPGKNDNILDDMVITAKSSDELNSNPTKTHSRKTKKRKLRSDKIKKAEISTMKDEPSTSSAMPKLSVIIDSDSDSSQESTDSLDNNSEDIYGELIWRLIDENGTDGA